MTYSVSEGRVCIECAVKVAANEGLDTLQLEAEDSANSSIYYSCGVGVELPQLDLSGLHCSNTVIETREDER